MPAHTTRPPLRTALSATGTRPPTGANMIAASSGSGGASSEPSRPHGAEFAGMAAAGIIAGPGEGKDIAIQRARHLGNNVCRCTEAIEPKLLGLPRHYQRAP